MKLRVWLNWFLIFYCVALLVFMFSTDERPFWYDVASFLPVIVLSAQSWYYWRKEQKIENVDDNVIKALRRLMLTWFQGRTELLHNYLVLFLRNRLLDTHKNIILMTTSNSTRLIPTFQDDGSDNYLLCIYPWRSRDILGFSTR